MSEPDISTLARRLAEQNNVDWRVLHGSGPEGKVVERDVLDYLAKVMAGEEAVNPTPEPVPEGMDAWPEQDMDSFRAGVGEATTLDELRDRIGNSSRDSLADDVNEPAAYEAASSTDDGYATSSGFSTGADDVAAPATAEASSGFSVSATDSAAIGPDSAAATGSGTIDEDIFLFEDDDDDDSAPVAADETYKTTYHGANDAVTDDRQLTDDLDDLLVAGDDTDIDHEMAASGEVASGDAAYGAFDQGASGQVDTFATASDDSRLGAVSGGYLSADSFGDTGAEEDDLPGSAHADFGAVIGGEEHSGAVEEVFSTSTSWDGDTRLGAGYGGDLSSDLSGAGSGSDEDVPDLWGPAATADSDDADLWTGADSGAGSDGVDGVTDVFALHADVDEVDLAAEVEQVVGQVEVDNEPGVDSDIGLGAGLAAVGATLLSGGSANLPLARPGTILRRNIDVSALAAAQLAVGHELGFDEPLSASVFLLRAVVKAAASTGFTSGAVGLAVLEEDVKVRRVDGVGSMSFTDLVHAVASASGEEDEPALVAADLSGLDVDEAVLELDAPVVSLGRILYDNQRGAYRSTLSLSGPMPLDAAAALLARVAELLDAPVRLVL